MKSFFTRAQRRTRRTWKIFWRKLQARRLGLRFSPPNYIYFPRFTDQSVIIDAGCGYEAEFSRHLINVFGVRAFGIDPTLKHRAPLHTLEQQTNGRFTHLPLAITAAAGTITFYESEHFESGSIHTDHTNVRRDSTLQYDVETLPISALAERVGAGRVDYLKLDLEGAEFEVIAQLDASDLAPFDQIFIEFHHHAVPHYSIEDTRRAVEKIRAAGYRVFSLDDHNYLFYR